MLQFADKQTERLYNGKRAKGIPQNVQGKGLKLLKQLNASSSIAEFKAASGKSLDKMVAERRGKFAVRIDKAYRLCFAFSGGIAVGVEIVDYHNNP